MVTQGTLWFQMLHPQVPRQLFNSQPASFFCQTAQKDKYLTVEATTLKYMHRVRHSHCHIEIMTCRHRADIYEVSLYDLWPPQCPDHNHQHKHSPQPSSQQDKVKEVRFVTPPLWHSLTHPIKKNKNKNKPMTNCIIIMWHMLLIKNLFVTIN